MDFLLYVNSALNWLNGQLAWLTDIPPAYIAAAAVVPVVARNLLATLWTILFALGTVSLCAMNAGTLGFPCHIRTHGKLLVRFLGRDLGPQEPY
jgi:hypothetical protein